MRDARELPSVREHDLSLGSSIFGESLNARPALPEAKRPDCPAKVDILDIGSDHGFCKAETTRMISLAEFSR